jgi:hypothetical protein
MVMMTTTTTATRRLQLILARDRIWAGRRGVALFKVGCGRCCCFGKMFARWKVCLLLIGLVVVVLLMLLVIVLFMVWIKWYGRRA